MTAADYVRVHCGECSQEVYANPLAMVLLLLDDGKGGKYEFDCPRCGPRNQDAHPWFAMQLLAAGVPIVNPADRMRDDMADDDAIEAELKGWDK